MKTELVMIVDKSGSMQGSENDTIGGINSFIEEQKAFKDDDGANLTLIFFDNDREVVYDSVDLREVKNITNKEYKLGGSTALLDTIGFAIETMKSKKEKEVEDNKENRKIILDEDPTDEKEKVLFCIITDGEENSSREYTKSKITSLITEQRNEGWEFVFLSADEDAIQDSKSYGIDLNNIKGFSKDSKGFEHAYVNISSSAVNYRSS